MKLRHLILLATLALVAAPATASAAPVWNLDIHHNQTHFPPGGSEEYWFDVNNVGDAASSGPVTITIQLPAGSGITRDSVRNNTDQVNQGPNEVSWSCPGSPGDPLITCTTTDPIRRHNLTRSLALVVAIAPGAKEGDRFTTAKLEGGGAAKAATAVERTRISSTPAGFGIFSETFVPDFFTADGLTAERQASSHPDLLTVPFDFNSIDSGVVQLGVRLKREADSIRNLEVDLPPGFIGAPTAVAECSAAQFNVGECPPSSQVGRIDLVIYQTTEVNFSPITAGVFNLSHPRGAITDLAFVFAGNPVHIKASLDPANRYAVTTKAQDVNETLPPFHQKLTVWGVPADPAHDSERCPAFSSGWGGNTDPECSTGTAPRPFLTLPAQCEADNTFRLHSYDSWQNPGAFGPDITRTMPGKLQGCELPRFEPSVQILPTGNQANTPTGLDVHIRLAQNENPNALATPPVKSTVVTLPQGMTVNPAFADGLDGCTLAQIGLGTNDAVACPDNSRIGEVFLTSPLLPKPLEGSMYLAKQTDNAFGSTFAMYLAVHDTEERGILVKIPGRIDLDPNTGQITTTFDDLPQFPFDDFTLSFRSGQRAPLANPPTCGTHRIEVQVTSYAQPDEVIDASNTYEVTEGPGGGPCPAGLSSRPFAPRMSAGTLSPVAGVYSPFIFRLNRGDAEQELASVTTVLPPGLLAKIAGVVECPDAAIASISSELGAGSAELTDPACPAASRIGSLSAGVGSGTSPNYFNGSAYLAGPYRGAPLSLLTVAPALAGPYDLGNVVVRVPTYVDPATAQVRAVSDPFPTILHGVLLRVRDVRLRVDRPQTTLNPTNCEPMSVQGQITGVGGDLLSTADDFLFYASVPFQVGECANLGFRPKLTFRLRRGTKRGSHPAFSAVLRGRPGDANIARSTVVLPRSTFIEQAHIRTVCTRVQFAADACPPGSVYGKAKATSPLFDETLEGPVYLRANGGERLLPDLVVSLNGRIEVVLAGFVDSVNERIRNTFNVIPDAPVTRFELSMLGGNRGLLVNSRDLCRAPSRAIVRLLGQNGKRHNTRPKMGTSCKKKRKHEGKRNSHRRR